MADASRFPQLAIPFSVVGACAGWLSAGMVTNPLFGFRANQPGTTICATMIAALTGAILTRACVGRRYHYEMGEPDPEVRPPTDVWPLHVALVVSAGAATGAMLAALTPGCTTQIECTLGGAACALAFLPVCLAVIAAARSAQRARLGSLVAGADRRAVWGILAMLLAVMTLEAAPDWPAAALGRGARPLSVIGMLGAAALCTLAILAADLRALAGARRVIGSGLAAADGTHPDAEKAGVPELDLGLGSDLLARMTRGAAAYRHHQRALALVRGNPDLALGALRRAVRRGELGVALIAAAAAVHIAACTTSAALAYTRVLCEPYEKVACALAVSRREPEWSRHSPDPAAPNPTAK